MEASALPASVGLTRPRIGAGAPLLRLRSDEQLVSLFRSGSEEAFRAIHDRYRPRMLAYARQMLAGTQQDPEDAVQEVFVRAYGGLRSSQRELALRAWLYRIAHNRCVDELRRPHPQVLEATDHVLGTGHDPAAKAQERDALRRLIVDVQRLPGQQRSALLMRELGGMRYADVAGALGVTVPAVKSLLVRARIGLAQASEARDTACAEIRADMIASHDRGVRTSGLARRHLRDCPGCRAFRSEVRGVSRQLAALAPTLGPLGVLAKVLGLGGGTAAGGGAGSAAAGSSAAAGTGVAAATTGAAAAGTGVVTGAAAGTGAAVGTGAAMGAGAAVGSSVLAGGTGHVVTLIAAALVATGGAVEIQHSLTGSALRGPVHPVAAAPVSNQPPAAASSSGATQAGLGASSHAGSSAAVTSTGAGSGGAGATGLRAANPGRVPLGAGQNPNLMNAPGPASGAQEPRFSPPPGAAGVPLPPSPVSGAGGAASAGAGATPPGGVAPGTPSASSSPATGTPSGGAGIPGSGGGASSGAGGSSGASGSGATAPAGGSGSSTGSASGGGGTATSSSGGGSTSGTGRTGPERSSGSSTMTVTRLGASDAGH